MKINGEFNAKLQHEFQGVSDRLDVLKGDSEHYNDNLTKSVECLSEGKSKRANADIVQTRK